MERARCSAVRHGDRLLARTAHSLCVLRPRPRGQPVRATARATARQARAKRETAAAEFAAGLDRLRASAGKTPATRRRLDAVALQWEWFRSALELQGDAPYNELVASESILQ